MITKLNSTHQIGEDGYYDLLHNRVRVKGFTHSDNAEDAKMIKYPGVFKDIYCITIDGRVYSIINEKYLSWGIRNGLPYVNLSSVRERGVSLEPFYIRDLMAYSYIAEANSYLERGYHAVNIDGDPMNCIYTNIRYINKSNGC